jgi:hypothetical protein
MTQQEHWLVAATFVYVGAVLAFLLTGLLHRGDPAWRGWAVYSLIAGLATIVLVAITFYTFSPGTPPAMRLGGLMERVLFIEILAWYVAFGWRLFRGSRQVIRDASLRRLREQQRARGVGR